jgi:hypothetical protein
MSENSPEMERSPAELVLFAIGFVGFVLGAAGAIINSVAAAISGFILLGLAVSGFLLRQFLGE